MELIDKFTVQLSTERGAPIPLFIAHTHLFDKATSVLHIFYLTLSPINIPLLQQLLPSVSAQLPTDAHLMIEFSLDDPDPGHSLDALVIPPAQQKALLAANNESRQLTIVVQEEKKNLFGRSSKRSVPIPGTYDPYLLDWNGVVGIVSRLRRPLEENGVRPRTTLLASVEEHIAKFGPATNLYTELGMLYRLDENWDRAIQCYQKEIQLGLRHDGQPGLGIQRACNNLGVLYKKLHDYTRARISFAVALAVNPNYFEALVSLAGILNDAATALLCVARAYRIRPAHSIFGSLIRDMAPTYGQSTSAMLDQVEMASAQVDLTTPAPIVLTAPLTALVQQLLS